MVSELRELNQEDDEQCGNMCGALYSCLDGDLEETQLVLS